MKERNLDVDQTVEVEQALEENLTETQRDDDQTTVSLQKPSTENNTEV